MDYIVVSGARLIQHGRHESCWFIGNTLVPDSMASDYLIARNNWDNWYGVFRSIKQTADDFRNFPREHRRNSVSNLLILLSTRPFEEVIVWKCLYSCSFTNSQWTALRWVWMNVVMPIFAYMTRNSGCRLTPNLDTESVIKDEFVLVHVLMCR